MTDWGRAAVPPSRGGAYAPPPPPPPPRAGGPAWGSRPPGGPRRGGGSSWLVVVLGLALAVAVAAAAVFVLRDEGGDQPAADVTGAELTTVLLTPADLGAGYAPAADAGDAGEGGDAEDADSFEIAPDTPDECRDVFEGDEPGETGEPEASGPENPDLATVDYDGPHEATLGHTVETHVPGELTLDEYRSLVDGCDAIEIADSEATGSVTLTTTDLDGLGDNAIGLQIDMHIEVEGIGIDIDGYSVMWERGGVDSTVSAFAGFDQASLTVVPVDQAWVRGLAATADARLAVLLDG